MSFVHVLVGVGHVVAFGLGYYSHYKWGTKVAADVAKVKSVV